MARRRVFSSPPSESRARGVAATTKTDIIILFNDSFFFSLTIIIPTSAAISNKYTENIPITRRRPYPTHEYSSVSPSRRKLFGWGYLHILLHFKCPVYSPVPPPPPLTPTNPTHSPPTRRAVRGEGGSGPRAKGVLLLRVNGRLRQTFASRRYSDINNDTIAGVKMQIFRRIYFVATGSDFFFFSIVLSGRTRIEFLEGGRSQRRAVRAREVKRVAKNKCI